MMTREEAAKWLEETIQDTDRYFSSCSEALQKELDEQKEVFLLALSALRPVSREQVKKVWRGYWDHKEVISNKSITGKFLLPSCECSLCGCYVQQEVNFCPHCGAPMTDEAVEMVMRRLEALHGETD